MCENQNSGPKKYFDHSNKIFAAEISKCSLKIIQAIKSKYVLAKFEFLVKVFEVKIIYFTICAE